LVLERCPGPTATAIDFLPFHRQVDADTGITSDDLELRTKNIIQRRGEIFRVIGTGTADDQFFFHDVLDGLDPGGMPGNADRNFVVDAANILKLLGIVFRAPFAVKRQEGDRALYRTYDGAILGCHVIDEVGGTNAGRALHELVDHFGLAGNVFTDMARHAPRISPVTTARAGSDDDFDDLFLIKIG
jgi:hypothetical protein